MTINSKTAFPIMPSSVKVAEKNTRLAAWRVLTACALAMLICSCAISKEYERPQVDTPSEWNVAHESVAELANTAWWQQFQDPVLDELITTALNENQDVRIAAARIEEFAGRLQVVESGYYTFAGIGALASRQQQSREQARPVWQSADRTFSDYQLFLSINWEPDIWGRLKQTALAAQAELAFAQENRQAVIMTLVTSVAENYLALLSLDEQLRISRETLSRRQRWLKLFEKKGNGGHASGLEIAEARSAYEQACIYIPKLELRIALRENLLSILLGRNPGRTPRGKSWETLGNLQIPGGLPSDLLIRRPDIRRSEQALVAAHANLNVARTLYFPRIDLTGLLGFASSQITNLLSNSAHYWFAGAGITSPIFTGGRIEGQIHSANAEQQQVLHNYLKTVQNAFKEVEDALIAQKKHGEIAEIEVRLIRSLKERVHFAGKRYDARFSTYLEVLVAENELYLAQIRHVGTQRNLLMAIIDAYKAMGGGWIGEADRRICPPGKSIPAAKSAPGVENLESKKHEMPNNG